MPEHDTFDLDAAFAQLEQDIAGISRPRDAAAAIATARRRRQTRFAIAALAVVVVAGGAIGLHGHSGSDVEPARRPLPAPAPLDPASLTAATAGWTPAWHAPSKRTMESSISARTLNWSCHLSNDEGNASSINGSSGLYQTDDGHFVQFGALRYDHNAARAHQSQFRDALVACAGAEATDVTYSDGSRASFVQLPALAGGTTEVGLVAQGHDLLELAIAPVAGITPEVRARLADAMVAGLQVDAGASGVPGRGTDVENPAFWAKRLRAALGDWQSGWSRSGGAESGPAATPCGVDLQGGSGGGETLGSNGDLVSYLYGTAEGAATAEQSFAHSLADCPGASYVSKTVRTSHDHGVSVVTGIGKDTEVIWVLRLGRQVGYLAVPAGVTSPPVSVSKAVGDLLVDYMRTNPAG